MAEADKPTHIRLEQDADVVISKGETTVSLRPDGSVYVNGQKIVGLPLQEKPAQDSPVQDEPVKNNVKDTVKDPPPDSNPPAEEAVESPEERRKKMIARFIQEGMSPMDAVEEVGKMLRQELAQKAAKQQDTAAPDLQAEQAPQPVPQEKPSPRPAGLQIGKTAGDKGVFIGTWSPCDKKGRSLDKIFNVFAAPEDVLDDNDEKLMLTFNEAAAHVAKLKDWHGHDGGDFANEDALLKALRKDQYKGEWVIPPLEMMAFLNQKGEVSKPGILADARDIGDLAGTFEETVAASMMYWTCTETPTDPDYIQYANLAENRGAGKLIDYIGRDYNKLATRLVRFEPRL